MTAQTPLRPTTLEVSLFGSGYGEAIAVHLPGGSWLLVDSCHNQAQKPASLQYLKEAGDEHVGRVSHVVATHWHDDHIAGMTAIIEECPQASFVMSSALLIKEFMRLCHLYSEGPMIRHSGLDEFSRLAELLNFQGARGPAHRVKLAQKDRQLVHEVVETGGTLLRIEVWSLSPADLAVLAAQSALVRLHNNLVERSRNGIKAVPRQPANEASVVIEIRCNGKAIALLGADLERTGNNGPGWGLLLNRPGSVTGGSSAYKVAHHAARSGYDPRIWGTLVEPDAQALVTPYVNGRTAIPTTDDIQTLKTHTTNAYCTSPPTPLRPRRRDRIVEETIKASTRLIQRTIGRDGRITARMDLLAATPAWDVQLQGAAHRL